MELAVFLTIVSLGIAVLVGTFLRNEEYLSACPFALVSVLLACVSAYEFRTTGFGTPLEESDLEISTIYQIVDTPVSHDEKTSWGDTENLVFLQAAKSDPLAYHLTKVPPPRFLVIENERGELEFLPRPLPEEKQPDFKEKLTKEKEPKSKEGSQGEENSEN